MFNESDPEARENHVHDYYKEYHPVNDEDWHLYFHVLELVDLQVCNQDQINYQPYPSYLQLSHLNIILFL